MLEKYTFGQQEQTDLSVYNCGIEDCLPGHSWGPAIRGHYILHLVRSGCGTFTSNGQTYNLKQGDIFLITPAKAAQYQADLSNPWSYVWVGFRGLMADGLCREAGLNENHPVTSISNTDNLIEIIKEMINFPGGSRQHELTRLSLLYRFFADLLTISEDRSLSVETRQTEYLRQAVRFIEANYAETISVRDIAAHVGLDRSYLYTIFQRFMQTTPKEYLTRFRMSKASELLHTSLSIGEIANSVGYNDALLFSKSFKKEKGVTPTKYRRQTEKNL